ncbi:hypothetical protein GXP67_26945 [Rhodocytophaga rosea]|uniref:Glycosyltransferase n=1 Tax=Rhodocytophaga rosea TaxID=2704465 RepID=A0A6C0GQY3_9BACT|nr:hypothetical protein [Rhodocytophaga rosea]QHT70023.1 hypothetical protein GXP67_26945 [Rhodocytophaga rosea]
MNQPNLVIATITLARNATEEKLLIESLTQLARLNIQVFITDGGSSGSFLQFLRSVPHFFLSTAQVKGVWAQAKNSLLEASQADSDFILYTEPDKLLFFTQFLPTFITQPLHKEHTGVILASRSESGFATFPAFQQMSERAINNCCKEIIKLACDYTYGPFILNKKAVPYLHRVQEDIGWGFRPYLFGIARRLTLSIESYEGDFTCPDEQTTDSATERIYRMRQLSQNIQGLVLSTSVSVD